MAFFGVSLVQRLFHRGRLPAVSRLAPMPAMTLLACLAAAAVPAAAARPDEPLAIGSRLEPLADPALLAESSGRAALRMHHPVPREVALVHDVPWEGCCGFYSVFQDGDRYRMYYNAGQLGVTPSVGGKAKLIESPFVHCYAESADGIHWKRPSLGLREFRGSTDNNIILAPGDWDDYLLRPEEVTLGLHGKPDAPPEARYLGSYVCYARDGKWVDGKYKNATAGLGICTSADGIHWKPLVEGPVLIDGPSDGKWDSQNQVFWDAARGTYRAYWRGDRPNGIRTIRTATSPDLVTWSGHRYLDYGEAPVEQMYTNVVMPWPEAPQVLLGMPTRYVERAAGSSLDALPDAAARRFRGRAEERFATAITEAVFMTSTDGFRFTRWPEGFLRPGPERPGSWQYGQQFIARGIVVTKSDLPGADDEYSLYASEDHWSPAASRLRRYTIRRDGFVSLHAPMEGGGAVTRPLRFSGRHLAVNFATSAAGGMRIGLEDAAGRPIPGFSLEECDEVFGDSTARLVRWQGGDDIGRFAGTPVRLRIELRDADLFTIRFRD